MARCIPSVYFGGVKDCEDQCFIWCVSVLLGVRWVVWCLAVVVFAFCVVGLCVSLVCGQAVVVVVVLLFW